MYLSILQDTPAYGVLYGIAIQYTLLQHTPAYSSLLKYMPTYYWSVYYTPAYSSLLTIPMYCTYTEHQHTPANRSIVRPVLEYSSLVQHTAIRYNLLHSSTRQSALEYFRILQPSAVYSRLLLLIIVQYTLFQHTQYFRILHLSTFLQYTLPCSGILQYL
jgi:hypothetical protein